MAASLRRGITSLLRGFQTWSQCTASSAAQVSILPGKQTSNSSWILSRFTSTPQSFGSPAPVAAQIGRNGFCTLAKNNSLPVQSATPLVQQVRTKVRYSRGKGKPKSVKDVPARFYRLNWGIWIRTRAGRHKKLWKKSETHKFLSRQHVFCNRTQSKLLDKMVTKFWRRPKYWVDNPYEPYHKRENFDLYFPERRRFFP